MNNVQNFAVSKFNKEAKSSRIKISPTFQGLPFHGYVEFAVLSILFFVENPHVIEGSFLALTSNLCRYHNIDFQYGIIKTEPSRLMAFPFKPTASFTKVVNENPFFFCAENVEKVEFKLIDLMTGEEVSNEIEFHVHFAYRKVH